MGKFLEKYRIRLKIFGLFLALVVTPYLVLILATYHVFQNYAGNNSGKTMEDMMISIGNQVSSSLKTYEDSTMTLYYNGVVDMLEKEEQNEDYIESVLAGCCYSYSGVRAAYLTSGENVYFNGATQYGNLLDVMQTHEEEIVQGGGRYVWFATDELFGRYGSNLYILARAINGKTEKNIGTLYFVIGDQLISNAFRKLQMDDCLKYMIDDQGNTLYSSSEVPLNDIISDEIGDMKNSSGYQIIQDHGTNTIVAYSRIEETGWTFVGCVSLDAMMQSVNPLKQMVVMVSIVYCLFLILVFYIFQKSFLKPISELKYAMDRFAGGDMSIQMHQVNSGELKSLSRHFNSMTRQINELIKRNEEAVNEKNNFKMQALMAQLQPHFIYNSLNTIKWMAVINRQDNIQKLTEALIYLLMNAANGKKDHYMLKDELELIRQYAVIQKARFMNFEIHMDTEPGTENCKIFQFLLQPAVENSIVHGFQRGMVKGGKIRIRTWTEKQKLYITVEDNGCGFDVEKWKQQNKPRENHTNIGLAYVGQIIQLEYGKEYGMQIISDPGEGTVIRYCIPLQREVE